MKWNAVLGSGIAMLVLAGCGQSNTTPTITNLEEAAPASATTKSKIGVQTWAIKGSSSVVEVRGQNSTGNTLDSLKITQRDDKTCDVVKTYTDSGGATVASLTIRVDKDGKILSSSPSGNPNAAALCPECMANDLKATDPSALSAQLAAPPSVKLTPCERSQRRIAQAAAAVVANCGNNLVDPLACALAQASYALAFQDFVQLCGNPFAFRVMLPQQGKLPARELQVRVGRPKVTLGG